MVATPRQQNFVKHKLNPEKTKIKQTHAILPSPDGSSLIGKRMI